MSAQPRRSAGEDSAGAEDGATVLVIDDADGSIYNKYGPNQYADRDVIVPSRPPTGSSDSRRLTPVAAE